MNLPSNSEMMRYMIDHQKKVRVLVMGPNPDPQTQLAWDNWDRKHEMLFDYYKQLEQAQAAEPTTVKITSEVHIK